MYCGKSTSETVIKKTKFSPESAMIEFIATNQEKSGVFLDIYDVI